MEVQTRMPRDAARDAQVPTLSALLQALRSGERARAAALVEAAVAAVRPLPAEEDLRTRLRAIRTITELCEAAAGACAPPAKVLSIARRALGRASACEKPEEMESLIRRLLDELLQPPHSPRDRATQIAERAAQYIRRHYPHDLSLDEVARYVGLSPSHFSTLFKREHGVGFKRFLLELRLAQARRLLTESPHTVEKIASAVGFEDAHYFSRVFSRAEGMPPGEYRRRAGG